MLLFLADADFQKDFATPLGSITVLAECHIFGDHLILDELLFYPTDSPDPLPIGVRLSFQIVRHLSTLAKEQGFARITVAFHRTGPRHHGRTITFTRSLR